MYIKSFLLITATVDSVSRNTRGPSKSVRIIRSYLHAFVQARELLVLNRTVIVSIETK